MFAGPTSSHVLTLQLCGAALPYSYREHFSIIRLHPAAPCLCGTVSFCCTLFPPAPSCFFQLHPAAPCLTLLHRFTLLHPVSPSKCDQQHVFAFTSSSTIVGNKSYVQLNFFHPLLPRNNISHPNILQLDRRWFKQPPWLLLHLCNVYFLGSLENVSEVAWRLVFNLNLYGHFMLVLLHNLNVSLVLYCWVSWKIYLFYHLTSAAENKP